VKGSFEAMSVRAADRAGFSGSTTTTGILWNDSFVLLTLIFGAIIKIRRNRVVRAVPRGSEPVGGLQLDRRLDHVD
jgi:hypothetical protein